MINVNLMKGDCLELMKSIPDGSVDLILTDPPYGTTACKWDFVIPFEPMWVELKRIIKPNGAIVLFGSEPFSSMLRCSNLKMFKYDWVWVKDKPSNFVMANKQPMRYSEYIHVFYKKQPTYNKQMIPRTGSGANRYKYEVDHTNRTLQSGESYRGLHNSSYDKDYKNPSNVLTYSTGRRQDSVHPTQKPVALLEYLIKTYTNEYETVLDFTAGSMSTAIACINTNRNGIMIEKDEHYFKVGSDRVAQALQELGDDRINQALNEKEN